MKSSLGIGIVAALLALLIIVIGWVVYMPKAQPDSEVVGQTSTSSDTFSNGSADTVTTSPPATTTTDTTKTPPASSGKSQTFTGTIVCLPHKDTSGPQTMECAYGLRDDSGVYYGLRDTDPNYKNIMNAPMDTQVKVTGTLTLKEDTKYQSIGVIDVTNIVPTVVPAQ